MKALFTFDFGKENMDQVRDLGYEVILQKEKQLVYDEAIAETQVLVCYQPFRTLDISLMKELKWIQLSSTGIDQVPKEKVLSQNIIVTNNRGGYSIPISEWIVLKLLEIYKRTPQLYAQQHEKRWHMNLELEELYGKKVTFVGTGSIASEAAKRLQGFGVEILGINTKGRPMPYFHQCYPMGELEQVLAESHAVVLTIPYTEATHHLLDKKMLGAMRTDALLINVSRGSIIHEGALIEALNQGKFTGVALDVFEEEPLPVENPLWVMDRVLVTSHNSWISEKRQQRRFETIYQNMKRYIQGEALHNVVDLQKGY